MQASTQFLDPPAWVSGSVIYQIFPDRFRRSGLASIPKSLHFNPWGSDPTLPGFQGGNLYGVIEALDGLQELGITCLYLTPIFSSAANHRYHAYDYFCVDPLLGGNEALDALIAALHQRGMRLILDGVFNHCGRGFWAFHHIAENGSQSPYRDWFHVRHWPIQPYPQPGQDCGYDGWWGLPDLPKFNHHNPDVCDYLLRVGRHWIERGIDGWRLDVPDEVPSDFWLHFRRVVRAANPEAWIVGEIWGDARDWLQGHHFDSVMNYRIGWSSLCWAAGSDLRQSYQNPHYPLYPLTGKELLDVWTTTRSWYRDEVNRAQLNLLDSHDVPRALHTLNGNLGSLRLALLLLFLQQGAPCVYYGTEAGLSGGPQVEAFSGPEPGCREAFPWTETWTVDLRPLIQRLVALRHELKLDKGLPPRWSVVSPDTLKAEFDGSSVWLNRSRFESWGLPSAVSTIDVLFGHVCESALGPQSACLIRP